MIASLCVLALAASVVLHLVLRRPALSVGLVDVPQGRKTHQTAVPLTGGTGARRQAELVRLLLVGPA